MFTFDALPAQVGAFILRFSMSSSRGKIQSFIPCPVNDVCVTCALQNAFELAFFFWAMVSNDSISFCCFIQLKVFMNQPVSCTDTLFECLYYFPALPNLFAMFLLILQFEYGFNSCLVGKKWMIIVRLGMGYALINPCP